jgi:transposase
MQLKTQQKNNIETLLAGGELSELQAREISSMGKEVVIFALLAQARIIAQLKGRDTVLTSSQDPSCPSAQKPVYGKENLSKKRCRKPGAKEGHDGVRRKTPVKIDRIEEHRLEHCPDCGSKLNQRNETRQRIIEDIPDVHVEVVKHVIHRDYCPNCKKKVEPKIKDALPNASIGNRLVILCAWLHYALGNTISQIVDVMNFHLQFKISAGGLVDIWHRLGEILFSWYEEICQEIEKTAVLHADETGWRVNGKTHWLWCFASRSSTVFWIDKSRASPVVLKFLKEEFAGVLVSDFWYAYNVLCCAKQKCLAHLLRELERTSKINKTDNDWPVFCKKLKRLLRDSIRLRKRKGDLDLERYNRRKELICRRLNKLTEGSWQGKHARRLVKRLRRHDNELFTFLDIDDVPFDNNFGERSIRFAVIMRKNSYNNRSQRGALTQSVLMSVFFTIKQRCENPVKIVKQALNTYCQTGQLPALKKLTTPDG